jgi:threonine/homoserine/homoserine lactone efflux protein
MLVDPARLGLFLGATVALLLVPGPAVLYVMTRSASQGRRAGLISVLGIGLGNAVHATCGALGLAALLASSPLAFAVVRYLGAGYLVVLGLRKLVERKAEVASEGEPRAARRAVFAHGIAVAVLNPKTALFFLAFLPQFVDPTRGAPGAQMGLLGGTFVVLGLVSDSGYALLAGTVGAWLQRNPTVSGGERYVSGAVYLALGVGAALARSAG